MRQAARQRRTWDHPGEGAWRPLGVVRLPCGCWEDVMGSGIWEPCRAHEGMGHLSVISEQDGAWVARCLAGRCGWRATLAYEWLAQEAAVGHWNNTAQR